MRQAEFAQQEWLARQQSMMQAQALAAMYPPGSDYAPYYPYGYGYGYGVVPVFATRAVRRAVPRVVHFNTRRL
jgi:hypothetical protein